MPQCLFLPEQSNSSKAPHHKMAIGRKIFTVVTALLCFTQVLEAGMVKRSADTTETSSIISNLQDVAAKAREAISNASAEASQLLGLNNLPAAETVANEVHNYSLSFARKAGEFAGQLQNEITAHQSEFSDLLQAVVNKWNETATTLHANTPEVRKTAQELQTSFSSGLQSFLEEAQKLVNAISPNAQAASENLQEIARTALSKVQKTANEFKTSLQAATQNQLAH